MGSGLNLCPGLDPALLLAGCSCPGRRIWSRRPVALQPCSGSVPWLLYSPYLLRWVQPVKGRESKNETELLLRDRCWIFSTYYTDLDQPRGILACGLPARAAFCCWLEWARCCLLFHGTYYAFLFSLYLRIESDIRSVPNSELLAFLTWEKPSACLRLISWTLWWDWWNAMLMAQKLSWHLKEWIDPTSPPNSAWAL